MYEADCLQNEAWHCPAEKLKTDTMTDADSDFASLITVFFFFSHHTLVSERMSPVSSLCFKPDKRLKITKKIVTNTMCRRTFQRLSSVNYKYS